ncbi:hypothetical protein JVU11DRAFT_7215 [Chiua virens]|nr:hypothetical protein JVU11DRAFT_7215 [Chiua virens]
MLVLDAVRATCSHTSESGGGRIAPINAGAVCESGTIGPMLRALHEWVLRRGG